MKNCLLTYISLFVLVGVFGLLLISCSEPEPRPFQPPHSETQELNPPTIPTPIALPETQKPTQLEPLKEQEPEPPPKPESVDNPPEITDYDIPESVYCGDEVKITMEAVDDIELDSVLISIKTPDGIQDIPLKETAGSWERVYIPEKEGSYILTAKVTDNKGQEVVKELGTVTVKADNPPEILSVTFIPWVIIYKDFEISVEATDDRGITEVKITFTSKGKLVEEITLEQTCEGVFASTHNFRTFGYIDYIVTVTDTKGQIATEKDDIFCEIGGGGGGL